ncbi:MAG: hypothetical protein ACTSQP_04270, partial [Promethearchaeota archaeon]
MKIEKNIKRKAYLFILILYVNTLCNVIFLTNNLNNIPIESKIDKNQEDIKGLFRLSDYSSSLKGIGDNINISIHQSLLNTSLLQLNNLSNKNTFKQACPSFNGFNTSYINVSINDIYAPNKTIIL